ncbi:unnamed protein product [Prunus armeniaca]|uniref:Uncharacterized protein n=1 Tax=Prunus armeniaca TaxID=36596 RepID=A0A6J5WVQ6_PRUAR|nr:unnamed protein product [Prunus armeniaca]
MAANPDFEEKKADHLYLATCPFKKLSNFFSNETIMNVGEKATRIDIIDFGIHYDFQWPCLIQNISSRPDYHRASDYWDIYD